MTWLKWQYPNPIFLLLLPEEWKQSVSIAQDGLPCGLSSKRICLPCRRLEFNPWVGKIPWRRKWQLIPVLLPENSIDRGAWWAAKGSDTTEQLNNNLTQDGAEVASDSRLPASETSSQHPWGCPGTFLLVTVVRAQGVKNFQPHKS